MIDTLKLKIQNLRKLDKRFRLFGSDHHKYKFRSSINNTQIKAFEQKHNIELPEDYRAFLLEFGNGGCGPGYGLIQLENGPYDIPHNKEESEIISLQSSFRFETYWNLEDFPKENYSTWEDEYDQIKWADGMLRIAHLGCGIYCNIIISGNERGNIWIDDRGSEGGIYPDNYYTKAKNYDFISWYTYWLDNAIKEITSLK